MDVEKVPFENEEQKVLKNHADGQTPVADGAAAAMGDYTFDGNDSTVKFVNGNADPELTVNGKAKDENEFVGLKKEELMKYATDPYWVKVRIILLALFALCWVAMLATAIAIIVVAPKCPPQPNLDWWQKSVIYHIHPQSFFDTNGDGFGDVKGIHEKVDYLKSKLHVGAVCIGPMNPSPTFEYGYNVANLNAICPHHYGKKEDLESLRIALHKQGIRLLLDFIPNHTSRRHPWFKNSSNSTSHLDYYIWREAKDGNRQPPNDWLNVYGTSAWTYDINRKAFYYHTFSDDEPDLNLRNPAVIADLDASLTYWLKEGIDGFRFYGAQYLVEPNVTDDGISIQQRSFQPESYDLVAHWREVLDNFSRNDGKAKSRYYPRLMIAEATDGTANETAMFMKRGNRVGAQIATNKALVAIKRGCDAQCIYDLITDWTTTVPNEADGLWSNWQLGSVDVSRVASRMNDSQYVNALNMLLLTLPGTPLVYYGEEIGMKNVQLVNNPCRKLAIPPEKCPLAQRSPMQWSDSRFAGFTTGNTTWLPVSDDYFSVNVEAQLAHGAGISPITIFSLVSELRGKEPSFLWGKFYPGVSGSVFFYVRQAEGFDGFLVAVNVGIVPSTVHFGDALPESIKADLPDEVTVAVSTGHFAGPGRNDAFKEGVAVQLNSRVFLTPGEGVVFRWAPKAFSLT